MISAPTRAVRERVRRGGYYVKPHIVYKLYQDMVYKKEGVLTVQN